MSSRGISVWQEEQRNKEAANFNCRSIVLRDILPLLPNGDRVFICHDEVEVCVLPENLRQLTDAGEKDFASVLDARVSEIVPCEDGTEIMVTDIPAEELLRFNEAFHSFQEAEENMRLSMTQRTRVSPVCALCAASATKVGVTPAGARMGTVCPALGRHAKEHTLGSAAGSKKVLDKARGSQVPLRALNTAPQRGSGTFTRGSFYTPWGQLGGQEHSKSPPLQTFSGVCAGILRFLGGK